MAEAPDRPKRSMVGGATEIGLIERRICTTRGKQASTDAMPGKADQKRGKVALRNRLVIRPEAAGAPRIQ